MKILIIATSLVTLFCIIPLVCGIDWTPPYNSLSSGHGLTIDMHGEEVYIGTPVTAWAGQQIRGIDEAKCRWLPPEGSSLDSIFEVGTYQGSIKFPASEWFTNKKYTDCHCGRGLGL